MTKTVTPTETATTFFIPADSVRAVWNAVSTEKTRYYLNGLYVETHDRDGMQVIATDGHVLLHQALPEGAFMGAKVHTQAAQFDRGFILSLDPTDKSMKAKTIGDAWLYGDTETGIIQVLDVRGEPDDAGHDRVGVLEFNRIDGNFPDWRRVLPRAGSGDCVPVCVNLAKLAQMQAAAKVFVTHPHARITAAYAGDPMLVEFNDACRGLRGVVMPIRF